MSKHQAMSFEHTTARFYTFDLHIFSPLLTVCSIFSTVQKFCPVQVTHSSSFFFGLMRSCPIDRRDLDEAEEQLIQQFAQDGCKCDLGTNKSPCCTTITVDYFRSVRCQMLELTHDELDLVVMGQVMAGCFSRETSTQRGQQRGKSYTMFYHNGARICQKTFLFLHTMGYWRFKAIKASYLVNGVVARVHGNIGK